MSAIEQHLRATSAQLCRFLGDHLPSIGGSNWWETHVVGMLTYGQQGQIRARGITDLGGLDLVALLRIFERNWAELSHSTHLVQEARTLARATAEARHACAHAASNGEPLAPRTLYRHLDTIGLFLSAIHASAKDIQGVEQDRLHALVGMAQGQVITPQTTNETIEAVAPGPVSEWKDLPTHKLGDFRIQGPGEPITSEVPSFSGTPVSATVNPWLVTGPGGLEFILHVLIIDEDGPVAEFGQVFCDSRMGSPQQWDDIVRRLRIGIRKLDDGRLTMDLRVAHRPEGERASRKTLSLADFDNLTGVDSKKTLSAAGATGVGARQDLYGESNRMKNCLAVTFQPNDLLTPAAGFLLTTICPML
jgi:hypothetical protein